MNVYRKKKKVLAYIHFHWDREWYREFEVFRMRLLKVVDNILEMLANDTLPSFYLDGQTIALTDYLEMRPEKESIIKSFIKEKRLFIGPFYCLIDEFLTDENCFKKNLEIGLEISEKFGCNDFAGYLADTFGHSVSIIPILKEYGIDKTVVWRGCGDMPSEFLWKYKNDEINTVNLIRGYFNDVFSTSHTLDEKTAILKSNLDKIAEKSGNVLLLPIGADHLGIEKDIIKQTADVNNLLDDYEIKIGTLFDYFEAVKTRFKNYIFEGELRDNSKTFILDGCYTARTDIKKYNASAMYKLDLADKCQKYFDNDYQKLIEYAYKLLVQNQAHDSICGCSIDDVHDENIVRYKKILQISDNIIDEIKFKNNYENKKILNLSNEPYTGTVEFKSPQKLPYQVVKITEGFDKNLLCDTQRIPVTEDYTKIYTYCVYVENVPYGLSELKPLNNDSDVFITDKCIGNSKIFLSIENEHLFVNGMEIKFKDYIDNGDSYNYGALESDVGKCGQVLNSKTLFNGKTRAALWIEVDIGCILNVIISIDKNSPFLNFKIDWENTIKNHLLILIFDTNEPVIKTYSEDMENIIERDFDCTFDIRTNLPKTAGVEAKTNTAPMHRGVYTNGIGIITKDIAQYGVYKTELRIPLLRATGVISNPKNPARTTPAGPPIEVKNLQMLCKNKVEFRVFTGKSNELKTYINTVFNKCIIL